MTGDPISAVCAANVWRARKTWDMSTQRDLQWQIRLLSEEEAVRALAAVVEDRGLLAAAGELPSRGEELREAVSTEDLAVYGRPEEPPTSDGELARLVLAYAADRDEALAGTVGEAVEYAREPAERFDGVMLGVAVLALTLLQTDVLVKRESSGRWSFTIRKRALRDSTLGKVLTALLSQITGGK
ncbi:hypothetical protein ACIRRH_34440 [Kitasatospora sp. NPDC101235]|uniref:hypothetical protein n=1 Tax=Kitasatospora sp. NPDC101235 TaxID=3364101 RepID=UPI0037F1D210